MRHQQILAGARGGAGKAERDDNVNAAGDAEAVGGARGSDDRPCVPGGRHVKIHVAYEERSVFCMGEEIDNKQRVNAEKKENMSKQLVIDTGVT